MRAARAGAGPRPAPCCARQVTEVLGASPAGGAPGRACWPRRVRRPGPAVLVRRPGRDARSLRRRPARLRRPGLERLTVAVRTPRAWPPRSEEHTSELQSRQYLVCRLLLEKKTKQTMTTLRHSMSVT